MTITALPDGPDPAVDPPAVFSAKAAASVLAQKQMVTELNAAFGALDMMAAGGGYSLGYTFSTTTTDGAPGAGFLRLSNATQNAATVLRMDTSAAGVDIASVLDDMGSSSSAVKGQIRLVKRGDPTKWLKFNLTAIASPTGYRNFTVVPVDGSSASPFINNDPLVLFFTRTGDKGDSGSVGGSVFLIGSADVGAAVANIDFLNVFSSDYDKYVIEIGKVTSSVGAAALNMRLASAGAVDVGSAYYPPTADGTTTSLTTTLTLASGGNAGASYTVEVRNANATSPKTVGVRGHKGGSSGAVIKEGAYTGLSAASGFRLYWGDGSNFTSGSVRVYGYKNT